MIQIVTSLTSVLPFTHDRCATMASADFSKFISPPLDGNTIMGNYEISPGNAPIPSRLYLPHIQPCLPCKYWTLAIIAASSDMTASYAVSVRQVSVLPAASFRFYLTIDTFAVRLILPLTGRIENLHLLEWRPAGRTI